MIGFRNCKIDEDQTLGTGKFQLLSAQRTVFSFGLLKSSISKAQKFYGDKIVPLIGDRQLSSSLETRNISHFGGFSIGLMRPEFLPNKRPMASFSPSFFLSI